MITIDNPVPLLTIRYHYWQYGTNIDNPVQLLAIRYQYWQPDTTVDNQIQLLTICDHYWQSGFTIDNPVSLLTIRFHYWQSGFTIDNLVRLLTIRDQYWHVKCRRTKQYIQLPQTRNPQLTELPTKYFPPLFPSSCSNKARNLGYTTWTRLFWSSVWND